MLYEVITVDLPIPPVLNLPEKVKLGHYGNHIAIFSGETSANVAKTLSTQPLSANGFYSVGFDYGLFADFAHFGKQQMDAAIQEANMSMSDETSGASSTSQDETEEQKEMTQVVQMLGNMRGMKLKTSLDFDNKGIVINGNMELPAANK